MKVVPRLVAAVAVVVAALAAVAAAAGLAWQDGGLAEATSVRGETVELQGEGLYQNDTTFIAEGSRGTDVVTLALGIPLLVAALVLARRGSAAGGLLLMGAFVCFLYVYAGRALGNAYNGLFPVYIVLLAASLLGLVASVSALNRARLAGRFAQDRLREPLGVFLFASAAVTTLVWLVPLIGAVARREAPKYLDTYTTTVTDVLDLGILVPTLVVAGVFVFRRAALGYVLAAILLVLLLFVAATIIVGTVFQAAGDVEFTTAEIVGPIAGFVVLASVGAWLLVRLLRTADQTEAVS